MNKQTMIIAGVVVLLLLGGGFFVMSQNKTAAPATTNVTPTTSQTTENTNAFTSIKDALSKSISLECSFTDDKGMETKSYIKNGAVRVDITGTKAADSSSIIMKDKKMYFWNETTKQGFMMDVPDVTPAPGANNQGQQADDVMNSMEKYKDSCKPSIVADSLFTPPADVKFSDMSTMMKGITPRVQTPTE